MGKSVHDGHRDRMRDKFLGGDDNNMLDHELIEMLLYYSIPRKNTNETAHALIEKFGSLKNVLAADADELQEVRGLGKNSATLIKLVGTLARRSAIDEIDGNGQYDTLEKIGNLITGYFVGVNVERTYLMMFDNSMKLIDVVLLSEGTINESQFPLRLLVEHAIKRNASSVVVAHNHPMGLAVPSGSDIDFTHQLDQALSLIGIPLLESIVVAGNRFAPIMRAQRGMFRSVHDSEEFFDKFYK